MMPFNSHIFPNNMNPPIDNPTGQPRPPNGEDLTMAPFTSHTSSIEMGSLVDNDMSQFQSSTSGDMNWMNDLNLMIEESIQPPTTSNEFSQIRSRVKPQAMHQETQEQEQLTSFTGFNRAFTADTEAFVDDNEVRINNNSAEGSGMKLDQAKWQELKAHSRVVLKVIGDLNLRSITHYQSLRSELQDNKRAFEVLSKQMEQSLDQGKLFAATQPHLNQHKAQYLQENEQRVQEWANRVTAETELAQEKEIRRRVELCCQRQAQEIRKWKSEAQRWSLQCQQLKYQLDMSVQQPQVQGAQFQQSQAQQPQVLHLPMERPQQHHPPQLQSQPLMNRYQLMALNGEGNNSQQHAGLEEYQQWPPSVPTSTDFQIGFSTHGIMDESKKMGKPGNQKRELQDMNAAQEEKAVKRERGI